MPGDFCDILNMVGDIMGDKTLATTGLRKPEKALTAKFVESAKEPGKYVDGHGLFLRVQPNKRRNGCSVSSFGASGANLAWATRRSFRWQKHGRDALANRKIAQSGGDPIASKREAEAVLTFEEAARKVYALHLPTGAAQNMVRSSYRHWKPIPSRASAN